LKQVASTTKRREGALALHGLIHLLHAFDQITEQFLVHRHSYQFSFNSRSVLFSAVHQVVFDTLPVDQKYPYLLISGGVEINHANSASLAPSL